MTNTKLDSLIFEVQSKYSVESIKKLDVDQLVCNFFGCYFEEVEQSTLIDDLKYLNENLNLLNNPITFGVEYKDKTSDYYIGKRVISDLECNELAIKVRNEITQINAFIESHNDISVIRDLLLSKPKGIMLYFLIIYPRLVFTLVEKIYEIKKVNQEYSCFIEYIHDIKSTQSSHTTKCSNSIFNDILFYETFINKQISTHLSNTFVITKNNENESIFKLIYKPKPNGWKSKFYEPDTYLKYLIKSENVITFFGDTYKILETHKDRKNYYINCIKQKTDNNNKTQNIEEITHEIETTTFHAQLNELVSKNKIKFNLTIYRGIPGCLKHKNKKGEFNYVVIKKNGETKISKTIVNYCYECDKYFMNYEDWLKIDESGMLLIIKSEGFKKGDFSQYNEYSFYRRLHYNVNAVENLSDFERRKIINGIISLKGVDVDHMIYFINGQINNKKGIRSKDNRKAIAKWNTDKEYLISLREKRFRLNLITREKN